MVMQDAVTAWDIKPWENTNMLFNVLCNVKPVEHPWTWDLHLKQADIVNGKRPQHWFEKCDWLKKCKLYEFDCSTKQMYVEEDLTQTKWAWWLSNFTDVITFQWYRIYMRKNLVSLSVYWDSNKTRDINLWKDTYVVSWWDWDEDTCDKNTPSNKLRNQKIDNRVTTEKNPKDQNQTLATYNTASGHIRIYIQQVDTKLCSWDTFDQADESPIVLVKEYEADECNPDHFVMWYGGIGTPNHIASHAKLSIVQYWWQIFAYVYNLEFKPRNTDYIHLRDYWLYVSHLQAPDQSTTNILEAFWLPDDWYFISDVSELLQLFKYTNEDDKRIVTYDDIWQLYSYQEFWEVPYFACAGKLYSINWFFTREDWKCSIPTEEELPDILNKVSYEERTWCVSNKPIEPQRRIFIFDNEIVTAWVDWVITWLSRRWWRLCYVSNNYLYVSWNGVFNWTFTTDRSMKDTVRNVWLLPSWVTDVTEYNSSLILLWPRAIYGIATEDSLVAWLFTNGTENKDWYYSPGSYYYDDWEFLIVRRWKLLESLAYSVSYGVGSFQFQPDTGYFVNDHIKICNNKFDIINIDATVNHRYISIFDNNPIWVPYSKLLIYDKHYKCWYYWLITNARVIHVKDWIFLWDNVYVNKWRTWWRSDNDKEWGEIIEMISMYIGEQWLQTPKHIQYVKTAIWDHSVITTNSKRNIDLTYWWKLFERRNTITTTRYPRLLTLKNNKWVIEEYDDWQKIYWYWEKIKYNLLNEITEYRSFDKYDEKILREMSWSIDLESKLATYASIKEPVNSPANIVQVSLFARWLDNIEFGSFYIWYYQLDADYEDIENTNIDISDYSDRTVWYWLDEINKWEFCDEILKGSAC